MYVGKEGSNWNNGHTAQAPLATIQSALDRAVPGDTIIIMPGTYREWLRVRRGGKQGKELVIRALQPGTVLITGEADPEIVNNLQWNDEGEGVYSAIPPWPIYRVKGDGRTLYQPNTLKQLQSVVNRENAFPTSCYEAGRLYVWFPDRRSPALHDLQIHAEVPPPGLWRIWKSANVWVEADHVRFEGLRFDFGIGSNLHLWNSAHVTVTNCLFSGAEIGINASSTIKPAAGLTVAHCLYHNYPQYEWRRAGWLSWGEIYQFYANSSLVSSSTDRAKISRNLVVNGGDALRINTPNLEQPSGVTVSRNLLMRCTDDAVEIEGFSESIFFSENIIFDCHESLGLSPVLGGPVLIEKNLFYHPMRGINGAQVKLMSSSSANPLPPIKNVTIRDNVFVGNWLCWYDASPIENVRVEQNVFAVQRTAEPAWPKGVIESDNTYLPRDQLDMKRLDFWDYLEWQEKILNVDGLDAPPGDGEGDGFKRPGPQWLDWNSLPFVAIAWDELRGEVVGNADE